jgi:hypothetical protein
MLTLETAVAPNPDVMAAEVEDGLVLLLSERNCYLVLNDTARAIWMALEHADHGRAIGAWLETRYQVGREQLDASVLRTLQSFLDRQLIFVR